jgi:hypothetical protein
MVSVSAKKVKKKFHACVPLSCYMDLIQPKCLAGIFRDASSKGRTVRELPFRDTLVGDVQTLHPKEVGGTEQTDIIPKFFKFYVTTEYERMVGLNEEFGNQQGI